MAGHYLKREGGPVTFPLSGTIQREKKDSMGVGHLHLFGSSVQELDKCAIFVMQRKYERAVNYQNLILAPFWP